MASIRRNDAADIVKGFLVIAMVAYHTLNYFVDDMTMLLYSYCFYVGPSFIFFSGIMCGTIYFPRFKEDKKYVYTRLLVRSSKLLALFFGINIIIHLFLKRNYTGQALGINLIWNHLGSIFLKGESSLMAFEILVPIAYVLLLSAFLLHFASLRYGIYFFLLLTFCVLSIFDVAIHYNLYFFLFGLAGFYSGLICTDIGSIVNSRLIRNGVFILLLFYFLVLIPSGVNIRGNIILFFLYVNVVLGAVYIIGSHVNPSWTISRIIIKFGQYSLFLYFAQIFFLQSLYCLGVPRSQSVTFQTVIVFVAINGLLILVFLLADNIRKRFKFTDTIYRFVFV